MKCFYLFLLVVGVSWFSCGEDEAEIPDDPISLSAPDGVIDLRDQYTVSTLTASFNGSGGASVDVQGNIYVSDFGNQLNNANGTTITKVDPESGELSIFATGFNGASGSTFDKQGNLFQANIRGDFISKVFPDGTWNVFVDIGNNAGPVGVVFDEDQNLYACNCNGAFISKIDTAGNHSEFVRDPLLSCPNGITIDDNGNLYPVNFNNGNVMKVTPDGSISVFATIPGNACAHITYFDETLYVLGRSAHQLFSIDMQAQVSLIAGSGFTGDSDGDGTTAKFFIPNGLAISNDGQKLYVVDRVQSEITGGQLNPVVVRVVQKK